MTISIGNNTSLINVSGNLSFPNYVVIARGQQVLGVVDATFELGDLPAEHHVTVVNYLIRHRVRIQLRPLDRPHVPPGSLSLAAQVLGGDLSLSEDVSERVQAPAHVPWWRRLWRNR